MLVLWIFGLVASIATFAIALAIAAMVFLVLAVTTAVGLVASSTLIAIIQKSPAAGLKALFLQMGCLAGGAVGVVVALILQNIFGSEWKDSTVALLGVCAGSASGLFSAWLFILFWGKVAAMFTSRISRKTNANILPPP